jgi:hypothetical protein
MPGANSDWILGRNYAVLQGTRSHSVKVSISCMRLFFSFRNLSIVFSVLEMGLWSHLHSKCALAVHLSSSHVNLRPASFLARDFNFFIRVPSAMATILYSDDVYLRGTDLRCVIVMLLINDTSFPLQKYLPDTSVD